MKKASFYSIFLSLLLLASCAAPAPAEPAAPVLPTETTAAVETEAATVPAETIPLPTQPETTAPPVPVPELTEEEKTLLLKLGMAERGSTGCTQCIALVMRSVINRIEAGHFRTIRGAIYAQDQYLPVADGSFDAAVPDEHCYEALNWILGGWDETQGALFYEWCEGESWHSKNLQLLLQHCDTRFYR